MSCYSVTIDYCYLENLIWQTAVASYVMRTNSSSTAAGAVSIYFRVGLNSD